MNSNPNNSSKRLADRLPVHRPGEHVWDGIHEGLAQSEQSEKYASRLAGLPVHKADPAVWSAIERRMNRTVFLRRSIVAMSSLAAGLLLLLGIFRLSETGNTPAISTGNVLTENNAQPARQSENQTIPGDIKSGKAGTTLPVHSLQAGDVKGTQRSVQPAVSLPSGNNQAQVIPAGEDNVLAEVPGATQNPAVTGEPLQAEAPGILFKHEPAIAYDKDFLKNYTAYPKEVLPEEQERGDISLAVNYLPEAMSTGIGTALLHNIGLDASVTHEKFRFHSSLGMAYNNDAVVYNLDYKQTFEVPIVHPNNTTDTTTIEITNTFDDLNGMEKHQFLTYDLGVGRQLFTLGRMTAWVNAGAGLLVRLDGSDLRTETLDKLYNNYNMEVSDVELNLPSYNRYSINLTTGIDVNYRLLKRLSLSLAPVSRIYLKPVLESHGTATDSFTFGFRTGMKFDF